MSVMPAALAEVVSDFADMQGQDKLQLLLEFANELPPIHRTVLRPALMRRGVAGDDSWGSRPHPEYRLPVAHELTFRFGFRGLG